MPQKPASRAEWELSRKLRSLVVLSGEDGTQRGTFLLVTRKVIALLGNIWKESQIVDGGFCRV